MYKKYSISQINRKTFTSLPQMNSYIRAGLFLKKLDNEKYEFDETQLEKLFFIKTFSKMNISLANIKYILTNLQSVAVKNTLTYYLKMEASASQVYYENVLDFLNEKSKTDFFTLDTFKFLTHNVRASIILTKLFEEKKVWYCDENKKIFLRKIRKQIYCCFKNFNISKREEIFENVKPHFEQLINFLHAQGFINWLDFWTFIDWIIVEPRYVKEMKRITITNEAKEIDDAALRFAIDFENNKY